MIYGGRLLPEEPVKAGAELVPAAVTVWLCPASALPVNVGAATVPVAVTVWLCAASALPVNVGALTVPAGVPADLASDSSTAADVVLAVGAAETEIGALEVPVPNTVGASMLSAPVPELALINGSSC